MKLYGVKVSEKIQKQKNQPDGKLFLTDRLFLCQRRFSGLDSRVAKRVLTPAGSFIFAGTGYAAHKKRGITRIGKSRPGRFRGHGTTKETLYHKNSLYGVNSLSSAEPLMGHSAGAVRPGSLVVRKLSHSYLQNPVNRLRMGRLCPTKSITGVNSNAQ